MAVREEKCELVRTVGVEIVDFEVTAVGVKHSVYYGSELVLSFYFLHG